jgi:putative transposase
MKLVTDTLGVARSNIAERLKRPPRPCSGSPEFTCWNGEVVRLAFALGCHDREAIGWLATTEGISGEMIRDPMVGCVEARFAAPRAPHATQWLSDNGPIYAAGKTIDT